MKKLLLVSAILSLALFSLPGSMADLAVPASLAPTPAPLVVSDARLMAQATPSTPVRLAAIGDSRGSANLRDTRRHDERHGDAAAAEGLPSTPVALASLLLLICILIGRRNTQLDG